MYKYKEKIGIIGGFGAYASLGFYKRILDSFASDCERNYPHIIMDNNFAMPSRTKALLCGADYDIVVQGITESFKLMLDQQVDKIILACGTAHYFLRDIYKILPQAKEKVVDIIEVLGEGLNEQGIKEVLIIAAEGTLLKGLYPERLKKYNVSCIIPQKEHYEKIRYFIECVKQNKLSEEAAIEFIDFLKIFSSINVVLGCTEFPVLAEFIQGLQVAKQPEWKQIRFFDPLEMTIQYLKRTLV